MAASKQAQNLPEVDVLMAIQRGDDGRAEAERIIRHMSWTERRQLHDAALDLVVLINSFCGTPG